MQIKCKGTQHQRYLAHAIIICLMLTDTSAQASNAVISQPEPARDGRIVGGQEISIYHFPHQVSLQLMGTHICGGSIISNTTILTAAHCVSDYKRPNLYTIRAGTAEHERGGVVVKIKSIIPHEHYNKPSLLNNDIALLLLVEPLIFNNRIEPIALVTKDMQIRENAMLFVSGWGSTSMDKQVTVPRLRYTRVQQQNQQECKAAYSGAGVVTAQMFCASGGKVARDSCQGDSGGPLVTYVANKQHLMGIVSWGIGCALPEYPGIYTRVAAFEAWIKEHME